MLIEYTARAIVSPADHADDLPRYGDWRPTPFDVRGMDLGTDEPRDDWRIGPCMQTRDSGPLDQSNYAAMLASIEAADPEGTDHEEYTLGHWGPGWFELVLIRPGTPAAIAAAECACALADYPLLDEEDHSRRESDAIQETWENMSIRDRVDMIKHFRGYPSERPSIFAARHDSPPYALEEQLRPEG